LAVARGFLVGVTCSGEAAGSPGAAAAGIAFGFAGAGLAVAWGSAVSSGEAAGSAGAAAAGIAFGFAGAGAGEALAVAWGSAVSSGEAGGAAAAAGARVAFGFASAGAGEALAVAWGFAVSSGEAGGSAVAVAPCSPVELGVAVDPGGHVIQHSAPAGNDWNVTLVTATSPVSRRDFTFMIRPPSFLILINAHFPSAFGCVEQKQHQRRPNALGSSTAQFYLPLFGGMGASKRQI
jgi:hypothetical protein